jgi:hypothetical protein
MFSRFNSVVLGVVACLSLSAPAFAGWTEVLSLSVPANGQFATTDHVRTSRLKVEKRGEDCRRVRMNFTAIGRDLNNWPILLGLTFLGENSNRDGIYQVTPVATVFDLQLQTVAGGRNSDCTYTFYAETLD